MFITIDNGLFGGRQTRRGTDSTSRDTADLLSTKSLIWLLCSESGLNIKIIKNKLEYNTCVVNMVTHTHSCALEIEIKPCV